MHGIRALLGVGCRQGDKGGEEEGDSFHIRLIIILIHVSKDTRGTSQAQKTPSNGLAVPGLKVNMPQHIGGKNMLFFNTMFCFLE
jgi:hypothetical protein